jgi:hypothetical protein
MEEVVDDRQARRDRHRRSRTHHGAPANQEVNPGGKGSAEGAAPEDHESDQKEPLATVAVREAATHHHQTTEDHGVRIDDPLQLAGCGL